MSPWTVTAHAVRLLYRPSVMEARGGESTNVRSAGPAKQWFVRRRGAVTRLVGFLAVAIYVGWNVWPGDDPTYDPNSVLRTLFDSQWVVGATRLLVAVIALYVGASILARVLRGEWLRTLGPAAAQVEQVAEDHKELGQRLKSADQTITELREQLAVALRLLDERASIETRGEKQRRTRK